MKQMYDRNNSNFNAKKCKVALLAGGKSNERDISIASGKGAMSALIEAGYQVDQFDPANKEHLKEIIEGDYDVAFLTLHGKGGEDGAIQGFLETINLPYTGPGIWSSSTCINKAKSKIFYTRAGVPTAPSITLNKGDAYTIDEIVDELGEKCVVKAATEGSSIGVYIVDTKADLKKAIEDAFLIDDVVLIEKYISGREYTVAVVEINGEPIAFPIIQIIPKAESYDFDSKYQPGGSEHICPADLPEAVAEKMKSYATQAHKALDCCGVSRNDFILDDEDKMWILETNTLPGMTEVSLLPDAARAQGISFPELCTILIKSALARKKSEPTE